MLINFTGEKLPMARYMLYLLRHKVIGGWYVRAIITNQGSGAGGQNECVIFVADPEHGWRPDNFNWQKIQVEPGGGIYRARIIGGWILFSTAQGNAKTDDGTLYRPRMGSLVFIPDSDHAWECAILEEKKI